MEDEEEGIRREIDSGIIFWKDKKDNFHRIDGPAIFYADGDRDWYRHGLLHRDDGPAREWPSEGREEWYKDGEFYEPSAHEIMVWKMKQKKEC
jgi:hypothetical protein